MKISGIRNCALAVASASVMTVLTASAQRIGVYAQSLTVDSAASTGTVIADGFAIVPVE